MADLLVPLKWLLWGIVAWYILIPTAVVILGLLIVLAVFVMETIGDVRRARRRRKGFNG